MCRSDQSRRVNMPVRSITPREYAGQVIDANEMRRPNVGAGFSRRAAKRSAATGPCLGSLPLYTGIGMEEFFGEGGLLEQRLLDYEYRPSQIRMAEAVYRALDEQGHVII